MLNILVQEQHTQHAERAQKVLNTQSKTNPTSTFQKLINKYMNTDWEEGGERRSCPTQRKKTKVAGMGTFFLQRKR